jgi:Bacteriophage tail sheath protein
MVYKTPGVYIEEIPAVGPIQGVGTSTVAFIGPAMQGPISQPTKITNWTQFKDTFGEYITSPRHYLAHAVEGFFKNQGTVAYIVRVSTAVRAWRILDDRGAGFSLRVESIEEGSTGNSITVQVQNAQIVTALNLAKPTATVSSASNDLITVTDAADAANFRGGDVITIQGSPERVTIDRVRGADIFLTGTLTANYGAGEVRIANLIPTQRTCRPVNTTGLEAGSTINIAQGGTDEDAIVASVSAGFVTLDAGLSNTYTMATADANVTLQSFEFNLIFRKAGFPDEPFSNLSMDARHSRYFTKIINSQLVTVSLPSSPSLEVPPDNRPAVLAASNLAGGTADNLSTIGSADYDSALNELTRVDDVNMISAPDRTDITVQQALIAHCESMADRFAILDSPRNAPIFGIGSVEEHRASVESSKGFAALYYPWISIPDPQSSNGATLMAPPSGHMAGIYARSDTARGVHKAPANELINNALALERVLSDTEQGEINIQGINVLRVFNGKARPIVWGARTTAPTSVTAWRYVNVRRLLLYIEESIQEGIQWAVFEPNNLALWEKLKRTISEFLTRVWKSGALFGATAEQAFYVKCDEELNPEPVRALGQVIVEIGVAPVRPAEFIIIRIGQWDGGAEVTEA